MPSSHDQILSTFKFTNAYRASDRTSQYLIQSVIYGENFAWRDLFARIVSFKLFNRIETWELLEASIGPLTASTLASEEAEATLDRAHERGTRIYSAAYIMPSAGFFGSRRKHRNHLRLLRLMLASGVDRRVAEARSLGEVFHTLVELPSIGPFLAYQFATDLNYSANLAFNENQFVMPGPGALDGMTKCFVNLGDFSPADVIRWATDSQREQFADRELRFDNLWGRDLHLIDCQNLFCEIAKYARVAFPEVAGASGRKRVKQRFRPKADLPEPWYPPAWGVNGAMGDWLNVNEKSRAR